MDLIPVNVTMIDGTRMQKFWGGVILEEDIDSTLRKIPMG